MKRGILSYKIPRKPSYGNGCKQAIFPSSAFSTRADLDVYKRQGYSFLDAVRAGAFTVPGDGDFDFQPVFDILAENGYEGWVVVEAEQDPAKANPFEYAVMAREYIRRTAGL